VTEILLQRLPHAGDLPSPARATAGSAGFDLASAETGTLAPGERRLFPTGFAVAIPEGFEIQIRPRSGLALKHGVTLPNTPATIDSDYRGELMVALVNLGREPFEITRGMRIAQLVVGRIEPAEFRTVDTLPTTGRGSGGFGSTGLGG
jgi:dUTP pyrophosphatase